MESNLSVEAFAALGHAGRLAVFRLLARHAPEGVRPSDIAEALGMKPNTLSVHVGALARAGLVTSRRHGKSVFYSIDLARTGALVDYLVSDCCRGRPELCIPLAARAFQTLGGPPMTDRVFNVLFICTGNSARSIFAESILAREGGGRFRAFSAGTRPYSELNPHAVAVLRELGHDVAALRAKNVAEFQGPDAPALDFVFTVCDLAANEECPPWPGQPISAHWGMPDPVKVEGSDAEKGLAFLDAYRGLHRRLSAFMELPLESLDRISLQRRLDAIPGEADAPARAD
ncbi:MAG: metalloregulator ArsR/SmtB family transcription factor [Pseudomonadota bacterium]|nr:metalloregulator ArsR/SmtB family transcription factor [Pseudomonadota bacterium]